VAADDTFLAKIMAAHKMFMQAMANEQIKQFSLRPTFGNLARFEFFRMERSASLEFGWFAWAQFNLRCRL